MSIKISSNSVVNATEKALKERNIAYDIREVCLFSAIYVDSGLEDILLEVNNRLDVDRMLSEAYNIFISKYNNHINRLRPAYRVAVLERYGFNEEGRCKTLKEVAEALGIKSSERARVIIRKSILNLGYWMRYHMVDGTILDDEGYTLYSASLKEEYGHSKIEIESEGFNFQVNFEADIWKKLYRNSIVNLCELRDYIMKRTDGYVSCELDVFKVLCRLNCIGPVKANEIIRVLKEKGVYELVISKPIERG